MATLRQAQARVVAADQTARAERALIAGAREQQASADAAVALAPTF